MGEIPPAAAATAWERAPLARRPLPHTGAAPAAPAQLPRLSAATVGGYGVASTSDARRGLRYRKAAAWRLAVCRRRGRREGFIGGGAFPGRVRPAAPPPASEGRRLSQPRREAATARPPMAAAATSAHPDDWILAGDGAVCGGLRCSPRRRRRRHRGAQPPWRLHRSCAAPRRWRRHGAAVWQFHAAAASRSAGAPLVLSGGAGCGDPTLVGAASPLMATRCSPAVCIMLHDKLVGIDASEPTAYLPTCAKTES